MAPVPATGFATTTSGTVGAGGAAGRTAGMAGASSWVAADVAPAELEGTSKVTWAVVEEHRCARPGGIAWARAWPHRDRAASSAIAPENDKWNSVTIHAKFARNSREVRESA